MGAGNDFTHRNTFDGRAISLDIEPSRADSTLRHIRADARTFTPQFKIDTVYMELFPSIDIHVIGTTNASGSAEVKLKQMRGMPDAIKNLAQYMNPRAKLEIEHIPHISFLDEKFYVQAVEYLRKENPFHCFLSPLFMENLEARKYIGVINKVNHWNKVRQDCLEKHKWSLDDTNYIIDEAVHSHHVLLEAIYNIQTLLGLTSEVVEKRLKADFNEYIKNPLNFLHQVWGTLSLTIAQEFSILNQKDQIRSFLEANGFEAVCTTRKDSIVNGRRNVWIISGQYKSS